MGPVVFIITGPIFYLWSYGGPEFYFDGIDNTRPITDPNTLNVTADVDVSIGYRATNNDRFFMGEIDDVRIYSRALSPAEVAGLAGRTEPFSRPFDMNADDGIDLKDFGALADQWLDELLWSQP